MYWVTTARSDEGHPRLCRYKGVSGRNKGPRLQGPDAPLWCSHSCLNESYIETQVTAVKKAFEKMFDGVQIECNGFDDADGKVKSQVADQPTSDFETQSGALNRAREAKRLFQEKGKTADFYVGVSQDFFL